MSPLTLLQHNTTPRRCIIRYHHVTVLLYTWFSYSARNPGIVSLI